MKVRISVIFAQGICACDRYASLYFCCAIEQQDNELLTLEVIHRYVELLDKYFGSVSILLIWYAFWLLSSYIPLLFYSSRYDKELSAK